MGVPGEVWDGLLATQPRPATWVVATTAAAAGALVLAPRSWPVVRHVVTLVHEGAHGLGALLTGRRLAGIRLHSDTSGVAVSVGRRTGPGVVLTTAAGYPGPGLIGLASAYLLTTGHAVGLLWGLLALLVLVLLQIRNWFGLWSAVATTGVLLGVTLWVPDQGQSAFAYLVTWFLLLASPRPVLELQRERRRARTRDSDADQLARLTGLPAIVWVALFLGSTIGALVLGARWLLA